MPSPFPGVDPFIEAQGHWADLHSRLISAIGDELADRLPNAYVARFEENVHTVSWSADEVQKFRPDVALIRRGDVAPLHPERPSAASGAATIEPVTLPLALAQEEVRDVWIEILSLPAQELVTVIEILSPTNKSSSGREAYLSKRRTVLDQPVHLVEIDLLRGGARVPMARPLPRGDFYTFVARAGRRPECDVYAWSVRDALPTIPIPLKAPDPDLPIDLSRLFARCYDRGRYASLLRYELPLVGPYEAEDRQWAEGIARGCAGG